MTDAQQTFIAQYLTLALRVASSILKRFVAQDSDAGSSAYFGLVEAAQKFDPEKGSAEGCVFNYVRRRVVRDFRATAEGGKPCKVCKGQGGSEVFDYQTGLLAKSVCSACFGTGKRDAGHEALAFLSRTGAVSALAETNEDAEVIDTLLGKLDDRQRAIIEQRFLGGKTQQQVADALGISRQYVTKIEKGALASLRIAAKGSPS